MICNQCALKDATTTVFRHTAVIKVCETCKVRIEEHNQFLLSKFEEVIENERT